MGLFRYIMTHETDIMLVKQCYDAFAERNLFALEDLKRRFPDNAGIQHRIHLIEKLEGV